MQNQVKNKNGKTYRKYGLLGYFSGVALYRLRYVDLKLGGEVIRSLKAQGYQLSWLLYRYDTYDAFEIEVQCKSEKQINYIKTFSVKKNIAKLQQKLLMLQNE
jgi:hypothetical protein